MVYNGFDGYCCHFGVIFHERFKNKRSEYIPMSNLPFVWELDYGGVQSHLVGTMHVLPNWSSVPDFKPVADELLCGKKNILLELEMTKGQRGELIAALTTQKIEDYWGTLDQEERACWGEITGIKPSMLATAPAIGLSSILFNAAGISLVAGVEEILKTSANTQNVIVSGLETVGEQTEYIISEYFQRLPTILKSMVDREKKQPGLIHEHSHRLLRNYLSGEEKALLKEYFLFSEKTVAIVQRNQKMAQRSLSYLVEPTVVAVGVIHCLGEDSMVDFYREQGITTKRV